MPQAEGPNSPLVGETDGQGEEREVVSDYFAEYRRKLTTAEAATGAVENGETIVYGMTVAAPPALLRALADHLRAEDVRDLETYTFLPLEHVAQTIFAPDLCDCIRNNSWFVGPWDRSYIREGMIYFVPSFLHEIPSLCRSMDIHTVMTTVSPMDKAGFFSFGTSNDYITTAARCGKRLLVEVNENMPRVFGDSLLHIAEVDAVVENHVPLLELKIAPPKPEDEVIGKAIAELVPDGACLQLGIGALPNAVARSLTNHRGLGIHSELFVPGMYELIQCGAVTGRRKNLHRGKHVFTTCTATREVYEFMSDNPSIASYPADYACSPPVIAQNDNMIAVNSTLEVDLTGQCNAESLAGQQYTGTGGQLDFVWGAYHSRNGKSIMAFYATAKGGTISRVVPRLAEGAAVTTPRTETQYLATEFGIVNLKGRSTRERALDIISIAHPDFRDDLLREAEDMHLV